MLSQTSEHALRALLYLARRPAGEPVPADAIAAALGAPRNYLAKTLNLLARRGILGSMRGPTGGFWLAGRPEGVTLADVVEVFDEPRHSGICLLGERRCDHAAPCSAHLAWSRVKHDLREPLRRTTLADLLAGEAPDAETTTEHAVAGTGAGIHSRASAA